MPPTRTRPVRRCGCAFECRGRMARTIAFRTRSDLRRKSKRLRRTPQPIHRRRRARHPRRSPRWRCRWSAGQERPARPAMCRVVPTTHRRSSPARRTRTHRSRPDRPAPGCRHRLRESCCTRARSRAPGHHTSGSGARFETEEGSFAPSTLPRSRAAEKVGPAIGKAEPKISAASSKTSSGALSSSLWVTSIGNVRRGRLRHGRTPWNRGRAHTMLPPRHPRGMKLPFRASLFSA